MTESMPPAGPTVLCLSRAYLSRLFPAMAARHPRARYLHVVQTVHEKRHIEAQGGEVVLCLELAVRAALTGSGARWQEPADFRTVTDFPWSPIHSDRYLPAFPPETQERIAGAVFDGLAKVFSEHRIDAFLSEPVALFVTHCALYLCRKHGARPLLWCNAWFPDWFYFADAMHISDPVRRLPMSAEELADLAPHIEAYLDGVASDRRGPAYHPSFIERRLSVLSYFKQRRGAEPLVVQPGLASRAIQLVRLVRSRAARLAFPRAGDFMTAGAVEEHRTYLRSLGTGPDCYDEFPTEPGADRVVYPLQYEPEASLLYFAPDFRDQPALVETVLRALPAHATLWVKEHPNQFGALGGEKWQRLKRQYGALRFVHGRQSGRDLIRRSGLVVSISSSAGMDALVLGRRVIVLGSVFYREWEGAIPVASYAELADALAEPDHYRPIDNRAALIASLVDFGSRCYPGDPQPRHALFAPENLDLLVAAVDAECASEMAA